MMRQRILLLALGVVAAGMVWLARADASAPVLTAPLLGTEGHVMLVDAIREQRVLSFVYKGHSRVVEPHAYGVSATGDAVLHAFQIEGGSASKPPPGWRTFNVTLIENMTSMDARFVEPRADFVRAAPVLTSTWAVVGAK